MDDEKFDKEINESESQAKEAENTATTFPADSEPAGLKKNRKNKRMAKKIISAILVLLLAAGAGFGGGMAALYFGYQTMGQNNITINPKGDVNTAEAVAEKVIPSVVGISTTSKVMYQSFFGTQSGEVSGVGTGIIIDEKGYILTNSHVVEGGAADTVNIKLADGREVKGTVLWSDSSIDLAIVKITADKLTAATLGNSNEVKVGSFAVAIGNPL
ncbi:MAG TPA: trypsin-like peptidase domain-containing protein, partial [Anaerovoracaceae bacterium]|nr:trypsin-like peptidase domain-containing protein [Anaerovoracaceae bacterium]